MKSCARSGLITVDVIVTELWGRNSSRSNRVCRELPAFSSYPFILKAFITQEAMTLREQFHFFGSRFWERNVC